MMGCATWHTVHYTWHWHGLRAIIQVLRGETGQTDFSLTNLQLTLTKMTVNLSKDVMLGMLRKGATGTDILNILNAIVSDQTETSTDEVSEMQETVEVSETDDEVALAAV